MADKQTVKFRLIHDGVEPGPTVGEPLVFGVQDTSKAVHPGHKMPGGMLRFDITLDVKPGDGREPPRFSGSFAHGPSAGRFLYLSWKRHGERSDPWAWRIKIPLDAVTWPMIHEAGRAGTAIEALLIGRRTHAREPVAWRVRP